VPPEIWDWEDYLLPYRQAVREICVKFGAYTPEFDNRGEHSPIESVHSRVKRVSSILEKAARKNIEYVSFDDLAYKIGDVAGVRIICRFEEDIARVVALIRERDGLDMHIWDERDYINHIKKSGYRSYHMHVRYTVQMRGGPRDVIVEIQIRTMAMNVWASTEHFLKYKYQGDLPEKLQHRLLRSAEASFLLDRELDIIRDELIEARRLKERKHDLGDEILRNIKKMYHHNPSENIAVLGQEFLALNEDHDLEKLQAFNQRLQMISQMVDAANDPRR
jgi:putative GTP pyrophosphokinase